MKKSYDFIVIGGGIIGLTLARQVNKIFPKSSIAILEKEFDCGMHASTNNSGVIHAGFYYTPGSAKAIITKKGNEYLTEYCKSNNVPFKNTGKLLVPRTEDDYNNLNHFYEVGQKNNVPCQIVSFKEAKEIEPNVGCKFDKLFYSPSTSIADQKSLIDTLKRELLGKEIEILTNTKFLKKIKKEQILTSQGLYNYK